MRILIVEDEDVIVKPVRAALERHGHLTAVSPTGSEAIELSQTWNPDVVLLDLMLPDISGWEVARRLRSTSDVPIIMVTARGEETSRVAGLDMGADDYVVKPFSVPELLARIHAVARRTASRPAPATELQFKDITLDVPRRRVTVGGEALDLPRKEFDLLRMLLERPGQVIRRGDLMLALWNTQAPEAGNSLDVHMSWLRKRLGDNPKEPRYIETVRGVGFRLLGT